MDDLREQDPLKQGLKLCNISLYRVAHTIREHDPLKQGLKLFQLVSIHTAKLYSRARSTKTRIETLLFPRLNMELLPHVEKQHLAKQGLKPRFNQRNTTDFVIVEKQHPAKQGLKLYT